MPGVGRFYPKYGERQFWSHVHSRISPQILGLSMYQVLCLGATIVEQDPYITYLDDQWTPTADCQNMT